MKEAKDAESEQESVSSEPAKEEEEEEEEEKKEEEGTEQENSHILDTVMKASLPNSTIIILFKLIISVCFGTGQRLLLLVYRYPSTLSCIMEQLVNRAKYLFGGQYHSFFFLCHRLLLRRVHFLYKVI